MSGYCLYKKLKRQVSYDNGTTWQDVVPAEYMRGDLIESNSSVCGYATYTRWIESGYTCDNYDKYAQEVEQTSNDQVTWTSTGNVRRGRLIEVNSTDCGYVPSQHENQYLTFRFENLGSQTLAMPLSISGAGINHNTSAETYYYSTDSGSTWSAMTSLGNLQYVPVSVTSGDTVMLKCNKTDLTKGVGRINTLADTVEGNVMSLLYGDNFSGQTSLSGTTNIFSQLFKGIQSLRVANYLILPATTLGDFCYFGMFEYCTSLITVPSLPATTLAYYCYGWMFAGCTSLATAPALPATTLADGCYYHMFEDCTSLTTAPVLAASELEQFCYEHMFEGCSSLNSITCLAISNFSAINSTLGWVDGVAANGTFTKDASATGWTTGVNGIPSGWTVVNNQ